MKIALCLSGQPRGIPLSCDILNNFIIGPNKADGSEVDVFFHTWHDESLVGQHYDSAQPPQNGKVGSVKEGTEEILVERLRPTAYVLEPQREFPEAHTLRAHPNANQEKLLSMFYSMYTANDLKKQYEEKNNFIYDCVIRTRIDLAYTHPIYIKPYESDLNDYLIVSQKFQAERMSPMPDGSTDTLTDIFAFSSSKNMDIFSSVYLNYANLNAQAVNPLGETILGCHVIKNNGIKLKLVPMQFEILHRVVDMESI